MGLALAFTERLPTAQELFSNGPHGGTGAYEIGTSGLGRESSVGFEVSVRRRAGFLTGAVSAFVNRFRHYIFEQELPRDSIPAASNPDGLKPFQFVARDAEFRGAEVELTFHLVEKNGRHLHLDLNTDQVRAEQTTDHQPLPRMPPPHHTVRLSYEDGRWSAGFETRRASRQNRRTAGESATPGHTLLNANLGYLLPAGRVSYEFFLRARNLGNVTAREATSFLKEFAPLPGRSINGGVRLNF